MNAPRYAAEALGPNVVLLRDVAVLDAISLVGKGIRATNELSPHLGRFRRLHGELKRAYDTACERHGDVVSVAPLEESNCQDGADVLSVVEAADLLGLSVRQVQRLAPTLGRRVGGAWALDRGAVLALKHERQEREDKA